MRDLGKGIIIIPDIHGRTFWREAASKVGGMHIVFLGDYVDPFNDEVISVEQTFREFEDIISFKRAHPAETTLLLGNHDLQYIWPEFPQTRYDAEHAHLYSDFLKENRDCFALTASFRMKGRTVIFSHAGILPDWLKETPSLFGLYEGSSHSNPLAAADIDLPNKLWLDGNDGFLCKSLSSISTLRGGHNTYGSMVWADVGEMMAAPATPGYFQVFGHTQQPGGPLVTDSFACVDCRRAFLLDRFTAHWADEATHLPSV